MPENFAVIYLKFKLIDFQQKDANGIANSEDLDQTAPLGAVWSGSALFAQMYVRKLRIITVLLLVSIFRNRHFETRLSPWRSRSVYRKVPKFSDARKLCCYPPKIQTKRPNLRFCVKKMPME